MPVPSLWYRWLLLAPFFLLSWELLAACWNGPSKFRRLALNPGLSAALIVAFTLFTAPWTRGLPLSLAMGSAVSLLGSGWIYFHRKGESSGTWKIHWSWEII